MWPLFSHLEGLIKSRGSLMWKHCFHKLLANGQHLCITAGRSLHPSVTPPCPARAPHHPTYCSDLGRSWCQRASEWPGHRRCRPRAGWRTLGRRTVAPCRRQVRPPRPSRATQTPGRRWNWRDMAAAHGPHSARIRRSRPWRRAIPRDGCRRLRRIGACCIPGHFLRGAVDREKEPKIAVGGNCVRNID